MIKRIRFCVWGSSVQSPELKGDFTGLQDTGSKIIQLSRNAGVMPSDWIEILTFRKVEWAFWANCITDGYIVVIPLTLSGKPGYVLEIGAPLEPLKTVEVSIRWP